MGEVHELISGVAVLQAAVPVTEVTLLEDRALVVRRGIVELPPGRSRLRITPVAPVLVDKTLSAELSLPVADEDRGRRRDVLEPANSQPQILLIERPRDREHARDQLGVAHIESIAVELHSSSARAVATASSNAARTERLRARGYANALRDGTTSAHIPTWARLVIPRHANGSSTSCRTT